MGSIMSQFPTYSMPPGGRALVLSDLEERRKDPGESFGFRITSVDSPRASTDSLDSGRGMSDDGKEAPQQQASELS